MKKTLIIASALALGFAVVPSTQASIVINFSTTGVAQFTLAPSVNQLRIDAQGSTSLTLADNTPQVATINNLYFLVGDSGSLTGDFTFDLGRTMTIASDTQTLSQSGTLSVTLSADSFLALEGAPPMIFNLAEGTVIVTPLSLQTAGYGVGGSGDYNMEASFLFTPEAGPDVTPVPESSTYIAGALLLLPFGGRALRIIRKNRTA